MPYVSKTTLNHDNINISLLSEKTRELIDLIGFQDTYLLVSTLGGQDVYIPKYPDRSKLIKILPHESVEILSQIYGGTYLALPTSRQIDIQERNKAIVKALLNGDSRAKVARQFGLSVRQVANVRKEFPTDEASPYYNEKSIPR
ncbi:helix-turn-helix domain-containing protein [Salinivibrio costicola]|uniref:Helix-turn-helix domain-containing protein n=1 Tax=Salinivibrio costicola TaxID=51367 RepID=A0ABX6K8I9_SALCS|nr:helix-turn-helix domain-containing protein [Salinivibrio costicola]QIR07843.1 helix-turn-helix domain-containing protein [Salinivibrio costicola]